MTVLLGLLANPRVVICLFIAVVLALAGWHFYSQGRASAEHEQAAEALEQAHEAERARRNADTAASRPGAAERLRNDWTRD